MKKPLKLPKFKNEDEERDFWAQINLADYYEPGDARRVSFPNKLSDARLEKAIDQVVEQGLTEEYDQQLLKVAKNKNTTSLT
ncbi:MAG: hypothetical protein A2632_00485 [Candidatus Pacebacteria bacterium RIFCSPHIGHO2_01_FULL_46_16]|nr:MAG: hypothetical protein A2632_00485 [Candidatus Pacebacteria bacterium RIFCSPHIGHO2_01_FULL_46_16]OGJ38725.1 MAG: hypothetical protein A3A82_03280 [Candidatus Pacebacteria bacterium RIFCSPLOWO2_01_FULL_47_12]